MDASIPPPAIDPLVATAPLRRRSRLAGALLAVVTLWAVPVEPAAAQVGSTGEGGRGGRPVVGLALSGGSAKGFAHIGVIRVLEELGIPVDVVAGTSMGSLVGGLYAIGFDAEELAGAARSQDWEALFTDRVERDILPLDRRPLAAPVLSFPIREGGVGLPTGVVRGDRILRTLVRLTWPAQAVREFDGLPRPFAAVATDLGSGEAVVLRSGVLAEAIRASLAIPGAIRPQRVQGRLLVDGGIARNLPAEDARALGADVVVCSDVSDPPEEVENLRSLLDVVLQTVTFQMRASSERQRELCDVLVEPAIGGISELAFGSVDEWVDRGVEAARAKAEELRAVAGGPPPVEGRVFRGMAPRPLLPERVGVGRLELRGVEGDARRTALRTVALEAPLVAGADTLDRALARLHATNLFSEAVYHVEAGPSDTAVVFTLTEGARNEAGFGFRYDDHRKASLLFSATLYNLLDYGSSTRFDLRLGEESHLGGQTVRGLGDASRFSLAFDARYTRALFDEYQGDDQVAEIRSEVLSASTLLGMALGRTTMAALGLQAEGAEAFTSIAPTDTTVTEAFWSLSFQLWRDTFDRTVYPSRGISLLLRTEWADPSIGSGVELRHHVGRIEQVVPLGGRLALRLRAMAGLAEGDELPLHRRFHLGGAFPTAIFPEVRPPFWGLEPQQRSGNAVQVVGLAVQAEVLDRVYATLGANAGNTLPEWTVDTAEWDVGWGLVLGAVTPVGPVEVAFSGLGGLDWPEVELNLGFRF